MGRSAARLVQVSPINAPGDIMPGQLSDIHARPERRPGWLSAARTYRLHPRPTFDIQTTETKVYDAAGVGGPLLHRIWSFSRTIWPMPFQQSRRSPRESPPETPVNRAERVTESPRPFPGQNGLPNFGEAAVRSPEGRQEVAA